MRLTGGAATVDGDDVSGAAYLQEVSSRLAVSASTTEGYSSLETGVEWTLMRT